MKLSEYTANLFFFRKFGQKFNLLQLFQYFNLTQWVAAVAVRTSASCWRYLPLSAYSIHLVPRTGLEHLGIMALLNTTKDFRDCGWFVTTNLPELFASFTATRF